MSKSHTSPTSPASVSPNVPAHPRLLLLSASVYAVWLMVLAYIAWQAR